MKKRILSLLLAVMMVVTVLVIPASATDVTNNYSFKFEDKDARNQTADQVIDFGYKGESKVDIVVDGVIDDAYTTYGETRDFGRVAGDTTNAPASVRVHFVVKDGYLYVAMESGLTAMTWLRVYTGVFSSEHSGSSMNRVYLEHNKSASGKLETLASANAYKDVAMNSGSSYTIQQVTTADYMKDFAWKSGIYEMKIDIGALYNLSASWLKDFSWDNPCLSFSFGFMKGGTGNPVTSAHTYYGITPADCKDASGTSLTIGSSAVTAGNPVPYTIIVPQKTLKYVRANYAGVGELGTDWRNAVDGQMAQVEGYAAVAPTMDGKVTDGDGYTTTHSLPGDITANYSIHDGYFYVAFTYEEAEHQGVYFAPFLMVNAAGSHMTSRTAVKISTTGAISIQGGDAYMVTPDALKSTTNRPALFGPTSSTFVANANRFPVTAASTTHENGVTTYEIKVFIADLISSFEWLGWDATEGNCIKFNFRPSNTTTDSVKYDLTEAERNAVANHSGHRKSKTDGSTGVSTFVYPTVALPKGCTDLYRITDVYDLEAYGQKQIYAASATATIDGVVNPNEYTASAERKFTVDTDALTAVDYFAQDDDYIYIGTVINHASEATRTEYNTFWITPFLDDGRVDVGESKHYAQIKVKGLDGKASVSSASVMSTNTVGTQETKVLGEYSTAATNMVNRFKELYDGKKFTVAVSVDGKVATYELAIKKSDLSYVFFNDANVAYDAFDDSAVKFNKIAVESQYQAYVDGAASRSSFNTVIDTMSDDVRIALQNLTAASYTAAGQGAFAINVPTTDNIRDIVNFVDYATKDGASVRASSNASLTGIRFKTLYSADYIAEMKALAKERGEELEIGTLIAPASYVEKAGAFTMEALEAVYDTNPYVKVLAVVDKHFASSTNGFVTYAGSLVSIKNLTMDFAGIGYIKIGDDVWYSDSYCVRNVSDVAKAAVADTRTSADSEYKYEVATGVYWYYDAEIYANFKALIAN